MEREIRLYEFVSAISSHLPDNWQFNDNNTSEPELIEESGARLVFRLRVDECDLVNVCGRWPKSEKSGHELWPVDWGVMTKNDKLPVRNFRIDLSPETVAKKLINSTLNEYTNLYQRCVKAKSELDQTQQENLPLVVH